jgi:hypothetical protein
MPADKFGYWKRADVLERVLLNRPAKQHKGYLLELRNLLEGRFRLLEG